MGHELVLDKIFYLFEEINLLLITIIILVKLLLGLSGEVTWSTNCRNDFQSILAIYFPQELKEFNSSNITVPDTWKDEVELKVYMVNFFDHDQEGVRTNQTAEYTFSIIASSKCLKLWTHRAAASTSAKAAASRSIGMHCDTWKWRGDRFPSGKCIPVDPIGRSGWRLTLDAWCSVCLHPYS